MAGTTPKRGLPYPTNGDAPNVAGDISSLATAVDTKLGSAGKSIIATSESRTNTAYGLLTTPDRVQNIVLPSDGKITVDFMALWQQSVAGAASAALFIGANKLKVYRAGIAAALDSEAQIGSGAGSSGFDTMLTSWVGGLATANPGGNSIPSAATTGQAIGFFDGGTIQATTVIGGASFSLGAGASFGSCDIWLPAGTYDISVQFKAASGSVTVKERKLFVSSESY